MQNTESQRDSETDPTEALTSAIVVEGAVGVIALLLGWWWDRPPLADASIEPFALGAGVLATLPALLLFRSTHRSSWEPFRRIRRILEEQIVPLFARCSIWQIAGVAALAGLAEEMLFRGVIQAALTDHLGEALALGAASVIFGLLHAITPAYAIAATVMGVYIGGLWIVTGNLVAPIVTHALYDFVAIWMMVRAYRRGELAPPPPGSSDL